MSWKKGHGNRDQLSNRVNADPEAGLVFRKHDEQMDSEINGLREKISMLKRITGDIGEEVTVRNRLINDLEMLMSKAQTGLRSTLRTVNKLYTSYGGSHLYVLILFAFALLMALAFWSRLSRFLGLR